MGRWWLGVLGVVCSLAVGAPTLESIEKIGRDLGESASLEKVLSAIAEKYPELRENFILMHESGSRQKASYEYPRVIAFTPDARFTLAFNGDPKASGFEELEMFEFSPEPTKLNPKAESFKFRRIIYGANREPDYRPVNEETCRGCHGRASLRPNWESYNLWEGAFFRTDHPHPGKKYVLDWDSKEHAGFDEFYTKQAHKGRYAFLKGLEDQYVYPTKSRKRIPTSEYAQRAGYLNYRRLAHLIRETPDYGKYKYAAIGALYDCDNFEKLLPKGAPPIATMPQHTETVRESFLADANNYFLMDDISRMAKFRFVFAGRGISMAKWSMSRRRSPYSFVTPGGSPEGFISDALMELDPSLEPYRVWRTVVDNPHYGVMSDFVKQWTGRMADMTGPACAALEKAVSEIR